MVLWTQVRKNQFYTTVGVSSIMLIKSIHSAGKDNKIEMGTIEENIVAENELNEWQCSVNDMNLECAHENSQDSSR